MQFRFFLLFFVVSHKCYFFSIFRHIQFTVNLQSLEFHILMEDQCSSGVKCGTCILLSHHQYLRYKHGTLSQGNARQSLAEYILTLSDNCFKCQNYKKNHSREMYGTKVLER